MTFTRNVTDRWHREVPGARWFKADLHVHTIDDLAGKRAKMPDGLSGSPEDPEVLGRYARRFLQGVVAAGVQVVGLTPHSPRVGMTPETSAVWKIVEEWNSGNADDGVPFREKIYAVFPGFEPSLKDGLEGLHLLFLFDPEIGRECYLRVFDLVMGGVAPWKGGQLQIATNAAEKVFEDLRRFRERECPPGDDEAKAWRHLVLAPHIDAAKGLLGAKHKQVLQLFDHGEVAGLELSDEKLPADQCQGREWLAPAMAKYRQAFFHGSDAYSLDELGQRHTWLKLASPRIEALRQAFIASDSRIRIGFERRESDLLQPVADPPDVTLSQRPWLKRITIQGEASFFGAGKSEATRFNLSPDLTCIIGGSMTGKSTLLDGLRVYVGASLPQDPALLKQVEERGRDRLLAGAARVELECPGCDSTAPLQEQCPAVFYAQSELQRLALESGAVEGILARLVPSELQPIEERRHQLGELDDDLSRRSQRLTALDEQLSDAEQAFERAKGAKAALSAFAEAGVDRLHHAGRARGTWGESKQRGAELRSELEGVLTAAKEAAYHEIDGDLAEALDPERADLTVLALQASWKRMVEHLQAAERELETWVAGAGAVAEAAANRERDLQAEVERALAKQGFDASRLKEFQALNRQASLFASYEDSLEKMRKRAKHEERGFRLRRRDRARLVDKQREAFDSVMESIHTDFDERIRARRIESGDTTALDKFLSQLTQRGVSRWWNQIPEGEKPSPVALLRGLGEALESCDAEPTDESESQSECQTTTSDSAEPVTLASLGMSPTVEETFREVMTFAKRRDLAAIRCPDRYCLELRLDDGSYRSLNELSGGLRVSVLLSLLLETTDDRPLVIDQPEDELDNHFLFETVLPALKKLKGRRQVIVATHNANIVVKGDADMVIQLEATANNGYVATAGAIEEPAVRDAIVRTVDGGVDAFRLRRLKYGF
jgi:hypothetical protein